MTAMVRMSLREGITEYEIAKLNEVADFLINSSERQDEEIAIKQKKWSLIDDDGIIVHSGYTHKEWAEQILMEHSDGVEDLQQILIRSFILSIFSFVEENLRGLCSRVQKNKNQKFSVKDLRGTGIVSCITYLDRVLDQQFMEHDKDLRVCSNLRNKLAHGAIQLNLSEQEKLLQRLNEASFPVKFKGRQIHFDKGDLHIFISFAEKVLEAINQQWEMEEEVSE
jgi:hypothetical protein